MTLPETVIPQTEIPDWLFYAGCVLLSVVIWFAFGVVNVIILKRIMKDDEGTSFVFIFGPLATLLWLAYCPLFGLYQFACWLGRRPDEKDQP